MNNLITYLKDLRDSILFEMCDIQRSPVVDCCDFLIGYQEGEDEAEA
jgi:hypothetical protein